MKQPKPGDRIYVRRMGDGDGRIPRRVVPDSSHARCGITKWRRSLRS